jgi:hypothetical protein
MQGHAYANFANPQIQSMLLSLGGQEARGRACQLPPARRPWQRTRGTSNSDVAIEHQRDRNGF